MHARGETGRNYREALISQMLGIRSIVELGGWGQEQETESIELQFQHEQPLATAGANEMQ